MSFEKSLFKIIGNRLKIVEKEDKTIITWIRITGFEIVLFVAFVMAIVWGIASLKGMEEINDLKVYQLSPQAMSIFWSVLVLIAIHLFLNRKTVLTIDKNEFRMKKRPLIPVVHKHLTADILRMDEKLNSQFYENDVGVYPDIYSFFLCFRGGKKLKIDSFNEEDLLLIKEAIQKHRGFP